MNRLFKKVVSSVLAATMMVGSVTVANVSSVFAEDTADIVIVSASKMTNSFDFSFSGDVTSGQDLGNGIYAVDDMTYKANSSFSTRTGYVSNDTNPTDEDGSTGGNLKYPVKGAALKFVAGADGTVIVDYYVGGVKTLYFKSVDSDGNVSTVSSVTTTGAGTGSYSEKVEAGKDYYFFGQGTKLRYYGVKFVADVKVTLGGTVTTDDGVTMPEKLIFTEKGTTNSTEATITDGTYSVTLVNGKSYDVTCSDGTLMATVGDTITVEESTTTHDVTIATASEETVTGEVVGLDDPSKATITFTKGGTPTTATVDSTGKYTVDLLPGTYSVAVSSVDGYTASSLSTADFTVKQSSDSTAENWKNVLYTKKATAVTSTDVYVGYSDKANNFATITEAMDAINVSSQSKYVVHIAPGTYQEQVRVKANNVTFTDDNKGGVTISWYYGIDYTYYSCNGGFYDKAYAVDKHAKGTPDRWGCTVQVTGNNFYAEGITFENTFNRSKTDAEVADGVTLLGVAKNTTVDRTTDFDPKAAASTERAAALVLDNNRAEIYNCKMLGSQDTLYVNTGVYYFNGCTIQGQTDYIFSADNSKAVFDDCNLVWAGYSTGAKAGYITAARGSMLFRNCTISNNNDLGNGVAAGYLGRHWGDSAKVIFADTKGMSTSTLVASSASGQIAYFADPSSLTKTAASVVTEAYVTTDTDYSNGQKYAEATEIKEQNVTNSTTLTATDVAGATYLGSWTPESYAFALAETDETETSDRVTVTWDFNNNTPSNLSEQTIQKTTADLDSNGYTLHVDATSGKLYIRTGNWAQFNAGTILQVPVNAVGDVVSVANYDTSYTVAGVAATAKDTTYTATEEDVTKGYVEVVASANSYIGSVSVEITPKQVVTKTTVTWDFNNNTPSNLSEQTIQKTTADLDSNGYTLHVDATSGKLYIRTGNWAQFNAGTILQVPVYAVGDTVSVANYDTSYTVAGVAATAKDTTYTATEEDVTKGYVEVVASANSYIGSITLVTTGTPSTSTTETTNYIKGVEAVNGTDTSVLYLYATVDDVENINEVGFIIAPNSHTDATSIVEDTKKLSSSTTTVYNAVSFDSTTVKASDLDGSYIFGTAVKNLQSSDTVYYVAYAKTADDTYYSDVKNITVK